MYIIDILFIVFAIIVLRPLIHRWAVEQQDLADKIQSEAAAKIAAIQREARNKAELT